GLKMMLYQPRDVCIVFQYKYGLAQPGCLSPAANEFPCPGNMSALRAGRECGRSGIVTRLLQRGKQIANV
ncbi:MAG: hypothetical protein ACXWC3_30290, partial [Burkholderiales bacterium]